MHKEIISSKQAIKMIIVLIIGSSTLYIMGLDAKMDIWFAILIAIGASSLIYCIYARILSIFPESDFYETLETLLGRPITILIISIFTLFIFQFGYQVLINYRNFIFTVGLTETPLIVISLSMMLVCAIAVKSGFETLRGWSQLFVAIIIGFLLLIVPIMLNEADVNDLKPFLYGGFKPVFKAAFGVVTFPFTDVIVFLLMFPAIKKGNSRYKIYLTALYVVGPLLLITSTANLMVLSPAFAENIMYPTYYSLSVARIGSFINRLEVIAASIFCMAVFFKISLFLLGTCKGISYMFNMKNYRVLVFPIALLMVNFSFFSFNSLTQYQDWAINGWPYYSVIFTIILPLLVLIILEIRYRTLKRNGRYIAVKTN